MHNLRVPAPCLARYSWFGTFAGGSEGSACGGRVLPCTSDQSMSPSNPTKSGPSDNWRRAYPRPESHWY